MTRIPRLAGYGAVLAVLLATGAGAFDAEYYEIPAGLSASVVANPSDDIYGLLVEDATWLRDTPLLGQLFFGVMHHDAGDAWYTLIGMMFRLMPHTAVAPFVGTGVSYNYLLSGEDEGEDEYEHDEGPESFWGGHAEGGVHFSFAEGTQFIELFARQTWNLEQDDRDFWLAGLSYGQNF
jgi:hypothetical protein